LNVSDHWPIWAEIETGTHASGVQHSGGVRT